MTGMMIENVYMLGTSLKLFKGEVVDLLPATNLPQGGWFARPRYRCFDGTGEDSIHLEGPEFVEVDLNRPETFPALTW